METQAAYWHYLLAPLAFAACGLSGHFTRAFFNVYPDKLTEDWRLNAVLTEYSVFDFIYDVEFDEAGYYRWDSWRNAELAIRKSMLVGCFLMVFLPFANAFAYCADFVLHWLGALAVHRWENLL